MSKFLYRTAQEIYIKHHGNLKDVMVILPTRRSVLFFQNQLAEVAGKSFWLPQTFVFPQFVEFIASRRITSGFAALTDLYLCYKGIVKDPLSFDVFSLWAATALKDFGDIDGSMANSQHVFSNLKSIREIDGWSFNSEDLSPAQLQFIAFWDQLGKLYDAYTSFQNDTDRWSYHGLVKNTVAHEEQFIHRIEGQSIYFIGIASFSTAEMALIQKFKSITETEVIWDADDYYVKDAMHEAGFFARKFIASNNVLNGVSSNLNNTAKSIKVYETTTAIGQCYGAAQQLKGMTDEQLKNTCVVIADEKLAEPFMASLALKDAVINLAIGVPLGATASAQWLTSTLRIKQKLSIEPRGVYHKDFMDWLRLSQCVSIDSTVVADLKKTIITRRWIYVTQNMLDEFAQANQLLAQLFDLLFTVDLHRFLSCTQPLLKEALAAESIGELEKASTRSVLNLLNDLMAMLKRYDFLNHITSLQVLWNQMLNSERLQYEGEPVTGLQVLGLRETRALDFDTVILIGANEETLPGASNAMSFIPFELRGFYNLPLPTEQENMQAYMFYRLLHHPAEVHLFYSTISSDFKGTEQSRYITQMESEWPTVNKQIKIERFKLQLGEAENIVTTQAVKADAFVHQRLDEMFKRGISPSAINKFNTCPLDFYYRYILGLGEEEVVEEQMSSATFGSVVHFVLEKFYEAFKNTYPTPDDYEQLKANIDSHLNAAFQELYAIQNVTIGYNHLARVVAKDMLLRIIKFESNELNRHKQNGIQPRLLDVEMTLTKAIATEKYDWHKPVALYGKVDRIEEVAGKTRILDYKTGKVEGKDVKLDKPIALLFANENNTKLVQLLSYIYMYCNEEVSPENVTAGFYSFVNHKNGFMMLDAAMTQDRIDEFEMAFMDWVKRVYATEIFEHNPKSKYCSYCS